MYTPNQLQAFRQALGTLGLSSPNLPALMDTMRKATFAAPASNISGINAYNLEPLAKLLFNAYTPLRNMIPRVPGKGTGPNWRAVTKIDLDRLPMGVPDGTRGPFLRHSTADFIGRYAVIDAGTSETFFAVFAAQGFDDLRSIAQITGLTAVQNDEERRIIGGLGTYGLGTAPTVTAVPSATAGSLTTATTYHVRVVALTADGFRISVAPTLTVAGQIGTVITRTSASPRATTFNVNGGSSQISADATGTTSGGATALDVSCAAVPGAVAYAWTIGSMATNGTVSAITTVNKTTLLAVLTGGAPPAGFADTVGTNFNTDQSQNSLVFDGIFAILAKTGSGALLSSMDGGTLTSDNAGGIKEWDAILQKLASDNLVAPSDIWFNFAHATDVATKISAGGTGDKTFHVIIPMGEQQGAITGGIVAANYKNKFALADADRTITLHVHPEIPPGTFLYSSKRLPPVSFPFANIPGVVEIETLQEYTQREYALVDMQYETSVSVMETMKIYTPFAMALQQNVAVG